MSMQKNKYRITQTLLSSWLYSFKMEDGYEKFLDTLNRKKMPQTKAMLDGIRFEGCVNESLNGNPIDKSHEWYKPVRQLTVYLYGSQQQVTLFKDIVVDDCPFLLHGVLDFLREGVIYDTKFSKTYSVGKYLLSPQHPMYFELCPEAYEFQYVICDGKYVYREKYRKEDCEPIENTIRLFVKYLKANNLWDTYCEKWKVKQ